MNFWQRLSKPIMVLAPLADVTDAAFRRIIAKYSAHVRVDLPAPRQGVYYVYAILCDDDSIYIGQTRNLKMRWSEHQCGTASEHTSKHKPVRIIHYEEYGSRDEAVAREKRLKTGFGRKWLQREYKTGRTRQAGGSIGGPDVMWTEFVSADGLIRADDEGKRKLLADLLYSEEERPIVAQLFSSHPEYMEQASALCRELGFDGIDINMGCPDKGIEKQGCGAAMIKKPELAREIIRAAKRGAGELPVSVKTRLGYNKDELEEWLPALLAEEPAVVTMHARTRKEMSKMPARWERVKRAVEIRDEMKSESLIFGNGDVLDMEDARAKARASGADGVMFGRAIFGNPWLFSNSQEFENNQGGKLSPDMVRHRLDVMLEHTRLFEELLPHKNFAIMKKHYKAYVNGFDGAKELRMKLMETSSAEEVAHIVADFQASFKN